MLVRLVRGLVLQGARVPCIVPRRLHTEADTKIPIREEPVAIERADAATARGEEDRMRQEAASLDDEGAQIALERRARQARRSMRTWC